MYLTRHEPFLDIFHNILGINDSLNVSTPTRSLSPSVDVIEKENQWTFYFDLPGVDKEHIDIEVDGNQLVVSGERQSEKEEKKSSYTYTERVHGKFQRCFTLPDNADTEKISAASENGVLKVHVEKIAQAQAQPRKIALQPN